MVTQSIAWKCLDAKSIQIIEGEWDGLTATELSLLEGLTREQLLSAIASSDNIYEQEQGQDRLWELERSLDEQHQLSEEIILHANFLALKSVTLADAQSNQSVH